ncbi:MAG TPA: HD-GYP domain-containing protein [Anaerolineaceae bacterium]|nr:HD-GYP domain-containing protein [Anaerolineaceae bacterium]HPN52749.1 HD-GYP domain-containing protein [Anaerolineaceae bacterium]
MKETLNILILKSLLTFATIIEARDRYTGGHTWRVSHYARELAIKAGFSQSEVFLAGLGGLIHDLGKVGITDSILNKNGSLTPEEYYHIKKHPDIGRMIVRDHPLAAIVEDVIWHHHERMDGKGYPNGFEGDQISPIARVVSIVDAFDAMTSTRAYRQGMAPEAAYQILSAESGKQFDARFVNIFLEMGQTEQLNHIIGHSGEGRLMVLCPACGPVIAISLNAAEGDLIVCPGCTGVHRLHRQGETFVVEWTGKEDPTMTPQPDPETIEDFVKMAPREIEVPAGMG